MSEPKTWGDVIEYQEPINRCSGYYGVKDTWPRLVSVGLVARAAASNGVQGCASLQGISPDHVRIVLRWLRRDRPPLTDPIPPEAPEPIVKVVRWEPTKEQEDKLWEVLHTPTMWTSSTQESVLAWLRDCQRDLPPVEPPMPPTAEPQSNAESAKNISDRLADMEWSVPILRDKIAALEARATKPTPAPIGKAAYNTPTTFEQALAVEPPTPDPVIPLPDGCTEIEGFPLLCKDKEGRDWTRSGYLVLPWGRHEVARMKSRGHSDAEIKQAARYAIREIARDAGL